MTPGNGHMTRGAGHMTHGAGRKAHSSLSPLRLGHVTQEQRHMIIQGT